MQSPLDILHGCAVFDGVEEKLLTELAALAKTEHYATRTLLVPSGQLPQLIRYVVKGRIELVLSTEDGREASLPIIAGRWASWLGCFHPQPIEHEMWSSAGASFLAFPATALRQCVASNPEALMRIILEVGNSLRLLIGWSLVSNLFLPEQRLAYALLAISSPREMEITQEQLGAIGLGSRQRVSRLLHSLEARGLVTTGYRSVSITDPDKLGAFAFGKSWRTGINSVLPGFGSK